MSLSLPILTLIMYTTSIVCEMFAFFCAIIKGV